jgi:hypothetical protein
VAETFLFKILATHLVVVEMRNLTILMQLIFFNDFFSDQVTKLKVKCSVGYKSGSLLSIVLLIIKLLAED